MAHPRMYDDDDPLLACVRRVCLRFPESAEVEAWGRPTFRAGKKMFAIYEGDDEHLFALVVKPDPSEAQALCADPRFYVPPYHGPYGWLGLDLTSTEPDWVEIAELAESSYRQVALKRMLRALDGL
jgi:hypothetical protein